MLRVSESKDTGRNGTQGLGLQMRGRLVGANSVQFDLVGNRPSSLIPKDKPMFTRECNRRHVCRRELPFASVLFSCCLRNERCANNQLFLTSHSRCEAAFPTPLFLFAACLALNLRRLLGQGKTKPVRHLLACHRRKESYCLPDEYAALCSESGE